MLRPLNDNVILKKEKAETTTASGIILTNPKEEKSNQAIVVAVGTKCDDELKEGIRVIYKEYSGTKFNDNDDEYLILAQKDILAIIE
ncbi:MAG: co-chaperone GroES [Bacilli bacterium]|nr:co-chaperone GroES [Bacilli bacterium]